MKAIRSLGLVVFTVVAVLGLLVGSVQAAPANAVSITLVRDGTNLSEISWSATGAINDGGDWTTENRITGGSDHSNAFVVTQVLTTQVGTAGSFHLRFQGRTNHVLDFFGNWELYDGTGAYAGLTGTGHWYVTFDGGANQLLFNLSGYIH